MHWDERACKSPLGFLDGRSWRSLAAREFGLTVRFPPVADIQAETPAPARGRLSFCAKRRATGSALGQTDAAKDRVGG
jgi:hypothetical protein